MPNVPPVVPWIVPPAPSALRQMLCALGHCEHFAARTVLQRETEAYESCFCIESGIVGQAVINDALYTKPLAMNLYSPTRLMGFINIFTGEPSPRRLIALTPVRLWRVCKAQLRAHLTRDFSLYRLMAEYCERAAKSELLGMEVLFTLGPQERFAMLCAAMLIAEGRLQPSSGQSPQALLPLPYALTREAMRQVVYLSRITFDRLLSDWTRRGWWVREPDTGTMSVAEPALRGALAWLQAH